MSMIGRKLVSESVTRVVTTIATALVRVPLLATRLDRGFFDEALCQCDDYDMWLRVACRGAKISYHQNPLGWVRPARLESLGQSKIEMHKVGLHMP
jgi:hypothetical protein